VEYGGLEAARTDAMPKRPWLGNRRTAAELGP